MSVLVVLLLIAITLGLSYASIRSQSVNVRIQRNAAHRVAARSAALSGLTMALKTMQTDSWKGVDTTLMGKLNAYENFAVQFTTGDPLLSAADADYDRFPLRVTLDATGYVADPSSSTSITTHHAQAVVELIPRALSEPPAGLQDLLDHTLSQWDSGTCALCVPFRVEGSARFRGRLNLSQELEWTSVPWSWYHSGLNEMRNAGLPDWRPLTGPVRYPVSLQNSAVHDLIRYSLQVSTNDTSVWREFTWQDLSGLTGYQLYPGGAIYDVPTVSASLAGMELGPDPKTNPAGLFARSGAIELGDGTRVRGSLFTRGGDASDIEIRGNGVHLEPVSLWPLDGNDTPIHLPSLVSADDIRFHGGSHSELSGLVLARDDFEVRAAHQNQMSLRLEGHAAARDLFIRPRNPWDRSETWWSLMWLFFWLQQADGIAWFPEWLQRGVNLATEPRLVLVPDAREVQYHYYNPNKPIYAPHPDDDGLRWNVVRWTMNP